MIRFINLKNQISSEIGEDTDFAFYNTVSDKFLDIGGSQVFSDLKDLEECLEDDMYYTILNPTVGDRLKKLIPNDYFKI